MIETSALTMNSVAVPGAKAAAQGSSNAPNDAAWNSPLSVTVTGSPRAPAAGPGAGVEPVSPAGSALQLAESSAHGDRMTARIAVLVMFSATPHLAFGSTPLVVGVDEAGRGPLAGPVVAAAVALCKPRPAGLDDSKKLCAANRARIDLSIRRRCAWGVGVVEVEEIDRLNIFGATMLAMTLAVARLAEALARDPDEVLVDGNLTPHVRRPEWRWSARPIVGGDAKEPAISAASIVAKEWRDRMMVEAARAHPHYGWERNKGYGTPDHVEALRTHGPTPLHRRSFAPVAQMEMF